MKKFIFAALIVPGLWAAAAEAGYPQMNTPIQEVLTCRGSSTQVDHGILLRIRMMRGPMGIAGVMNGPLVAQMAEQTFLGPQPIAQYRVNQKNAVSLQPAVFFEGTGFNLEIRTDPRNRLQDGFAAQLQAEARGARIAETLVCQFMRSAP